MQIYDIVLWMLFFFLYSFAGWVWESLYVSIKKRRPVNRGFLHGPFLPLYGSGAVLVLAVTMSVRDRAALVFFLGMAGATVLEYITGMLMEHLFHVKYWDYSKQKFNINGYICPLASLCWGCFSVMAACVVHPPIAEAVRKLPGNIVTVVVCVLTAAETVDFIFSFREALDMKEFLVQVERSKAQIRRLQDKLRQTADGISDTYRIRLERKSGQKVFRKSAYLDKIHARRRILAEMLEEISARVENAVKGNLPPKLTGLSAEKWKQDLTEIKENVFGEVQKLNERSDKKYLRIARMLRRNPTAVSGKFKETLDELKNLINGRQ